MIPGHAHLKRRRFHAGLLAALALVLAATGCLGLLILQGLPHREVNELVELLAAGIGVVMAAGGVIADLNDGQTKLPWPGHRTLEFYRSSARWLMAMLQLAAMTAMILVIYYRLLGHPLPRF
ncbi:MAG: hypothetical protein HKL95_10565 [Phycisphaerae bacterium]|nr:hypothetical protein [Phycisphaerae bacterium]